MNNFLTAETNEGLMDIFVAAPSKEQKHPVVIVLQEAFGVNHHIQSICLRLAQAGFLAIAPDLFHREGRRITVDYSNRKDIMPLLHKLTNDGIVSDVKETVKFLETLPHADTDEINVIGFCVGGFASALVATELDIKRMIAFYGAGMVRPREGFALQPIVNHLKKIKAQSLFFFGGADASIPKEDRDAIKRSLEEGKVDFEIVTFDKSDHGFFCDERKTFDAESAPKAWEKTLTFLRRREPIN